jgi:hypothetical protein
MEIPRLLKVDPLVPVSFLQLKTAFLVHFAFYDHLLDLKALFVVPPATSTPSWPGQAQPGSQQPLEWRPVSLDAVTESFRKLDAAEGPAARGVDRCCRIPLSAVVGAFGGSASKSATLSFDELVFKLLTNADPSRHLLRLCRPPAPWQPRDAPEV